MDVVVWSMFVLAIVVILFWAPWSGGRNLEICLSPRAVWGLVVGSVLFQGVSMVLLLWLFCSRVLGRVGGIWKSVSGPWRSGV